MKPIKLQSTYATVDVMRGRVKLLNHVRKGGQCYVVIRGYIDREYGCDDGTSREFCMNVEEIDAGLIYAEAKAND